jgi:hypothetical protein
MPKHGPEGYSVGLFEIRQRETCDQRTPKVVSTCPKEKKNVRVQSSRTFGEAHYRCTA